MTQRKIGTRLVAFVAALAAAVLGFAAPALAETYDSTWSVVFTAQDKMESTFSTGQIDEKVNGLQPGDSVTFHVTLSNQNAATTDWYMENEVLSSLERSSTIGEAQKGAYSYKLTYTDHNGETTVLYDSTKIGGDKTQHVGQGLEEATDSLDEMFYLDTLATGQGGQVDLLVALEGETQGNSYQDTQANLQLDFAVEKRSVEANPTPASTIKKTDNGLLPTTGDPTSYVPIVALTGVAGAALLIAALLVWRRKQEEQPEGGER